MMLATPLPPLNFNQIGKIWPMTGAMIAIVNAMFESLIKKRCAITKNARALNESRTKVIKPNVFPKLRVTFVAPILPDPCLRISPLPANLVIR